MKQDEPLIAGLRQALELIDEMMICCPVCTKSLSEEQQATFERYQAACDLRKLVDLDHASRVDAGTHRHLGDLARRWFSKVVEDEPEDDDVSLIDHENERLRQFISEDRARIERLQHGLNSALALVEELRGLLPGADR